MFFVGFSYSELLSVENKLYLLICVTVLASICMIIFEVIVRKELSQSAKNKLQQNNQT
jgi:hypothetical protein